MGLSTRYEEQMKASIKKLQRERAQLSTYLNDKSATGIPYELQASLDFSYMGSC